MATKLVGQDGTPVKYQGQDVFSCDYSGVVKGVDMEKRRLIMIGTDETRDRDGDIIRLSGWKMDNYRKNPVFLWAHNYGSVPIARAEKVTKRKDPPRMEFQLVFPTKGIYPFADMILELYDGKFINTSSVGFIPAKWEPIPEEEKGDTDNPYGRLYVSQELLELSGCAVPSNPNALQNALKGKDFGFKQDDLVKYLSGATLIPRPIKEDDVLDEVIKTETEIVDETHIQVQVPDKLEPEAEPLTEAQKAAEEALIGIPNLETGTVEYLKELPIDEPEILAEAPPSELKPYPNEHACRLADPGDFDKFARKNCFRKVDEKCVDYIFGIKDNKSSIQALRFNKDTWTEAAAKGVCSRVGGSFEAAKPPKAEDAPTSMVELVAEENKEVKEKLDAILNGIVSLGQTLQSVVDGMKDFQASLTKVNGDGQRKSDVVDPASTILTDAFRQGKEKSVVVPTPSDGTAVSGYTQESILEFKQVLLDFAKAIQSLNKSK